MTVTVMSDYVWLPVPKCDETVFKYLFKFDVRTAVINESRIYVIVLF